HKEDNCDGNWHNRPVSGTGFVIFCDRNVMEVCLKCLMKDLGFSNAMTFMLPNSGIVVRLPTLLHKYENDAPEGVGYAPNRELTYIDLQTLLN
ncbi:MAG: hypothetical protein AB7I27_19225, partial [Bacteriovoracaceae bacterium]